MTPQAFFLLGLAAGLILSGIYSALFRLLAEKLHLENRLKEAAIFAEKASREDVLSMAEARLVEIDKEEK